jgi:nitrite reductase/ring-hydroxylating ferredoxin subunit
MEGLEKVAETSEVPMGDVRVVKVSGIDVMVANVGGTLYATATSALMSAGLSEGELTGSVIQCPWHGSRFDVKTGALIGGPAQKPEPTFQVKVENSAVWIKGP